MKLTVTYPLYRRRNPSNLDLPVGFINDGELLEIKDVYHGKPIDGNPVWYKGSDDFFYWSGGFNDYAFLIEGFDFFKLNKEDQYILAASALDHYFELLRNEVSGFTGMSVTYKQRDEKYLEYYALVVQVKEKLDVDDPLPKFLPHHGYAIPVDVIAASVTEPVGLGDSISRKHILSDGSAGFVTSLKGETEKLLVTNYHVACIDLMMKQPRKLSVTIDDLIDKPEMVMPANGFDNSITIGELIGGRLDRFNDIALVKLMTNTSINNTINFIGGINGIRSIESIKVNFRPAEMTVQMFGARSGFKTGLIESFNSRQVISYLGGDFDHVIKGLIQVTKMSQPGDSGSAVVDLDRRLVGILVAADDRFSYIIPVENILANFNLNQLQ